jgi:cobalt-zinc-cadmium efflux system protein
VGAHHHHHGTRHSHASGAAAPTAASARTPGHAHAGAQGASFAAGAIETSRALTWALVITALFAIVEGVGGWLAGSLALISDAGHMATDAASLGLALFAQWIARRPPSRRASYGYARAEVLAAFVNALLLLALVVFIAIEAVERLLTPQAVDGSVVLVVAIAGLLANLASAWILSRAQGSLNARGAMLHVLSDLLGSLAAIVAGAVIIFTRWTPIDPILSLAVSLLIVRSTWRLLAQSTGVLMEGVPAHLDFEEIGRALTRIPDVSAVHDLHVWQMSSERVALSAHLLIGDASCWPKVLLAAQKLLADRFEVDHVTLQPTWHSPPPGKRVIPVTPIASDDKPSVH